MNDAGYILVIICLLIWAIYVANAYEKQGYKKGQIDAQNGIIKIIKQTQPDSSVVWIWKEETK